MLLEISVITLYSYLRNQKIKMSSFKNFLKKVFKKTFSKPISEHWTLWILLFFVGVWSIEFLLLNGGGNWDGSAYIGIGKYFFSNGNIGLFEPGRPVLLPILEGLAWFSGISPLATGIFIAISSSFVLISVVYFIGEKIKRGSGLIYALILAATPFFVRYIYQSMTDIPSTALAVLALWLASRARSYKDYFGVGLVSALAFLMRFPQGLIVVVIGLMIIFVSDSTWTDLDQNKLRQAKFNLFFTHIFKRAIYFILGFFTLVGPYLLVINYFLGDPFRAIHSGYAIADLGSAYYHQAANFYLVYPLRENPFLSFFLAGLILAILVLLKIVKFNEHKTSVEQTKSDELITINRLLFGVTVALAFYSIYFSLQGNKEIRFALSFLPYMVILSGWVFTLIILKLNLSLKKVSIIALFLVVSITTWRVTLTPELISPQKAAFEHFFQNNPSVETAAKIISTTPVPVSTSDVYLQKELYDSWKSASIRYEENKPVADYVVLDSCVFEASCHLDSTCLEGKDEFLTKLSVDANLLFSSQDRSCHYSIYKIKE